MAFWQYPWHITVARLRRTSTGFPCSSCSPQATKPICSFQAKEKATQADFCQCDRMFSQPAFLHPISGMRSGFSHGRYSGSRILVDSSANARTQPSQVSPMTGFRRQTGRIDTYSAVSAWGLSPRSLFKPRNRPALPRSHKKLFPAVIITQVFQKSKGKLPAARTTCFGMRQLISRSFCADRPPGRIRTGCCPRSQ